MAVWCVVAYMSSLVFWPVYTAQLIVSDTGLEYQALGFHIYTDWNDVDHTRWQPFDWARKWGWRRHAEVLVLRRSRLSAGRLIMRLKHLDGSDRMIPIGHFAWNWRERELGDTIRQLAPHLRFND